MFDISEIGKEMLKLQADLAEQYHYKPQPENIALENMQKYQDTLPSEMKENMTPVRSTRPGFEIPGKDIPLYSKDGTKIADKYDRIVIGHYGAFIEISNNDVYLDNIKCTPGQEYRINNPHYAERVKYQWMTTKDDSDCKLYYQQRGVTYADYVPGKWYISPFEVCDERERDQLYVEIEPEID